LARIVASPVGCGWAQVRLCESTEKKHGLESVAHHPFTGGQRNDIDIQPHSERDHHNCHHRSLCDVEYAHEHHQFLPRTPALTLAESQHLCNKAARQGAEHHKMLVAEIARDERGRQVTPAWTTCHDIFSRVSPAGDVAAVADIFAAALVGPFSSSSRSAIPVLRSVLRTHP